MPSNQRYLDLYEQHRQEWTKSTPKVVDAARAQAAQHLTQQGLPTKRVERYKYTSAEEAFASKYAQGTIANANTILPPPIECCAQIAIINDQVFTVGEQVLPSGLRILSFAQAEQECPELLTQYYHKAAAQELPNEHKHRERTDRDAVTMLNTMLVQDGILIHLAQGVQLEQPIYIHLSEQSSEPTQSHRRFIIVAESESKANILIDERVNDDFRHLSTLVSEVYVGAKANLTIYSTENTTAQNKRFANYYVEQQVESQFNNTSIALETGITRNQINVRLLGEGCDCQNIGMAIARRQQHIDNNLVVDHAVPHCTSDMLYKYVLDNESLAIFAGKVMVRPDAQKTLSQQTNNNLLLSKDAKVRSQPMLEIYADDVRCNHGSTIGTLDDIALLYLRQRGIPLAQARLLLQQAFIEEVFTRIENDDIRDYFKTLTQARFQE